MKFYKVIPYHEFMSTTKEREKDTAEHETEERFCIHHGCGVIFKDVENKKKKTCHYHPKGFDFMHGGMGKHCSTF